MSDDLQLMFLDPKAPISGSQLEELTSMVRKAFVDFNTSVNCPQEVVDEEFGDPMIASLAVQGMVNCHDGFAATDSSGKIVGVSFVNVSASGVASLGPVASSVPGAGRKTFVAACNHAESLGFKTLVLQQITSNVRAFSLYAKLGFEAKHTCYYFGGFLPESELPHPPPDAGDVTLTAMTPSDVKDCATLYLAAHGTDNGWDSEPDITESLESGSPFAKLVARNGDGKVVGYTSGFFVMGHTVAVSQDVFSAMFAKASQLHQEMGLPCPRFNCPMEYPGLVTWALKNKLSLFRGCAIMAKGPYQHAWPNTGHIVSPGGAGW